MAGRPGVRGGSATRGFRPGSAQALVALVLGLVLAVVGLQRQDWGWAAVFLAIAAFGAWGVWGALRDRRSPGD